MRFARGMMSRLPFAAIGTGDPVVVLAGAYPVTGVAGDRLTSTMVPPAGRLVDDHRVHVINRFPNISDGATMSDLARIHADAFRRFFDGPVELIGTSTGGSIAQQIASEHPDVVGRLVLASTAYTLGDVARREQTAVADLIDEGEIGSAAATYVAVMAPGILSVPAGWLGRIMAGTIFPSEQSARDFAATVRAEDAFDISRHPTITAPTLIVGGADDAYYPTELFSRTAELIPGSHLEIIAGRGHVATLGDPRVQQMVRDFLT